MHLSVTLLPEPEYPMMTVFRPSGTSRVTPSSTRLAPNDFVRPSSWIIEAPAESPERDSGPRGGIPSPSSPSSHPPHGVAPLLEQHERPERVQHQDGLAAEHHGPRGGPADTLGPALGVEPLETAHEGHRPAEAR